MTTLRVSAQRAIFCPSTSNLCFQWPPLLSDTRQIQYIVDHTPDAYPGVGVLTASNRDIWAKDYATLTADPHNATILEDIHLSAVLCLDTKQPMNMMEHSRFLWHVDKPVQVIVFDNAKAGIMGEHSIMDGTLTVTLCDAVLDTIVGPAFDHGSPAPGKPVGEPKALECNMSIETNKAIVRAGKEVRWKKVIEDHKMLEEIMHNLLEISLAPSVLKKCRIIIRLWSPAFHRLLKNFRRYSLSSKVAMEHLQDFIHYAYTFLQCYIDSMLEIRRRLILPFYLSSPMFNLVHPSALSTAKLEKQIQYIVEHAPDAYPGVGVLTASNRDVWAKDYAMLTVDPHNAAILEDIHLSVFMLCLNTEQPTNMMEHSRFLWHGSSGSGQLSLHNRWVDEPVQVIMFDNAKVGIMGEHSIMDSTLISMLCDMVLDMIVGPAFDHGSPAPGKPVGEPKALEWNAKQDALHVENGSLKSLVDSLKSGELTAAHQGPEGGIEVKEDKKSETNMVLKAKNSKTTLLEARVQKAYSELEEERRRPGCVGTVEKEEIAVREKMKWYKEKDEALRKQGEEGEEELDRVLKSESGARSRVEEIEEAFREGTVALENARAEIEGLRSEITNLESLTSDPSTSDSSERLVDIVRKATSDRARSAEEIAQLKATVEELRLAKEDLLRQLNESGSGSLGIESSSELGQVVERLTVEKADLEQELHDQTNAVTELRERLEKQAAEAESIRKRAQRDLPVHEALHDAVATPTRSPSRHDSNALRGEIAGLKLIIQELQKENVTAAQQNKLLESENKLLLSETDQFAK
ncbi:hypothetical protein EW146_g9568 [Bondarzewia mesenterica]|uniref:Choline/carnitine acyltransferase domain-containing protein n=1 Tax=Bondarzewia mesenterica TaxID=1095465 RepID=A0A4S4L5E0_9AGAM|nr:hypothetical protein EW146_g9568 [Bondarzewia mesenterica]